MTTRSRSSDKRRLSESLLTLYPKLNLPIRRKSNYTNSRTMLAIYKRSMKTYCSKMHSPASKRHGPV